LEIGFGAREQNARHHHTHDTDAISKFTLQTEPPLRYILREKIKIVV
jgi:hypothetical protein